jgi:hypothetical protein
MRGNDFIFIYLPDGSTYATMAAHVTRCYVWYFDDAGNYVRVYRDKAVTQRQWALDNNADYQE